MKSRINEEITFRKLEVLQAFMQTGNLARAAEQLDTSAVSVHRALHSLESALGCQLFRNEGRNLVATRAALVLSKHAQDVIDQMERTIAETRQEAGFSSNVMRIGSLYSLTSQVMPQVLIDLKLRRAELKVEMVLGSNDDLRSKIISGQIDVALMGLESADGHVENVPLFDDAVFFAVPRNEDVDETKAIDLQDYASADFVSLSGGFVTFKGFQEAFRVAKFEPKVVAQVGDIYSLTNLVASGIGFTLLPGRVRDIFSDRISLLPLQARYQMRQQIGLVFLRARARDPNILAVTAASRMAAGRLFPRQPKKR